MTHNKDFELLQNIKIFYNIYFLPIIIVCTYTKKFYKEVYGLI